MLFLFRLDLRLDEAEASGGFCIADEGAGLIMRKISDWTNGQGSHEEEPYSVGLDMAAEALPFLIRVDKAGD